MEKSLIIFLVLFTTVCQAQKETVYEFKRSVDYGIGGSCLLLAITDYSLSKNLQGLEDVEILALDVSDLPAIDRGATKQNSQSAKDISDICEYAVFFVPAPLLLASGVRREAKEVFVMYFEAFSFNVLSNQFVKYTSKRIRPFVYNESIDIGAKRSKNARKSFYSGHVSHTATMSIFTAKVFSDMFPDSKWKPVVWASALAVPVGTGYLRYKAGQHYPSDIAVGLIAGSLIGYLVPELHKVKEVMPDGLSLNNSNNGISLTYSF